MNTRCFTSILSELTLDEKQVVSRINAKTQAVLGVEIIVYDEKGNIGILSDYNEYEVT